MIFSEFKEESQRLKVNVVVMSLSKVLRGLYKLSVNTERDLCLTLSAYIFNIIDNMPTKPIHESSNRVGFFMPVTFLNKLEA